jgi:hypothetical protein
MGGNWKGGCWHNVRNEWFIHAMHPPCFTVNYFARRAYLECPFDDVISIS